MINFTIEDGVQELNLNTYKLKKWIKKVAATHDRKVGDINYIFCNDERILAVNREFLEHDYYTDIISFDYSVQNVISGDLFISTDTVFTNAELFESTFQHELMRVIIHGVLHLCGQGDKTPETQAEMTRKENAALEILAGL